MPGFGDTRQFVVLDHRPGSVFRWLQSIERPDLAFVIVDPLEFRPDYPLHAVRRSLGFLELGEDEDVAVIVICTVPPAPAEPTANFMAPIGIGLHSRKGAQVVLHEAGFGSQDKFLNRDGG